jgi:hypothetical protein
MQLKLELLWLLWLTHKLRLLLLLPWLLPVHGCIAAKHAWLHLQVQQLLLWYKPICCIHRAITSRAAAPACRHVPSCKPGVMPYLLLWWSLRPMGSITALLLLLVVQILLL